VLLAGTAVAAGKTIIATGELVKGTTTYPAAVLTYDQAMDDSDTGSNPGIELWSDGTLTKRLMRSNDNNGQWDYDIAGAYFANGEAVVYGTRTGSHGPQGRVWKSGSGSFLLQSSAVVYCTPMEDPTGVFEYGPFTIVKGTTTYTGAYVQYDKNVDDSGTGSCPGLRVFSAADQSLWRANDNNGQWKYRVDCVYAFDGVISIVGARSANGGQTWSPRIWRTLPNGNSFLTQFAGLN